MAANVDPKMQAAADEGFDTAKLEQEIARRKAPAPPRSAEEEKVLKQCMKSAFMWGAMGTLREQPLEGAFWCLLTICAYKQARWFLVELLGE